MKIKSIKDTIHGYIQIEEPFWRIIDTAEFQRLKWIEQTSYRVLYPSARHDRFIHSIGVYHLGQKAINGLIKNCKPDDKELVLKYKDSFLLGCLLHDLGHAPFSHTCEDLYNYQNKIGNESCPLNSQLFDLYKENAESTEVFNSFKSDYRYIISSKNDSCKPPSEHEVMSSILTVKNFSKYKEYFGKNTFLDLDLAIRAILGCVFGIKATDSPDKKKTYGIKNCLIRLLNSPTVDVDKLDYIARDTQMSGYDNIVLDNERLLDSTCLIIENNGIYFPAFKKSVLSVISNVMLAKNLQAQWIVNHPIVLYDAYLLRRAIGISIKNMYDKEYANNEEISSFDILLNKIFSHEALSKEGITLDTQKLSLLSDVELLSCMKQNISDKKISEYFARDERKSPIWKSHEEFLFYLGSDSKKKAEEISEFMAPLMTYLNKIEDLYLPKEINKDLKDKLSAEDINGKDELLKIIDILISYTFEGKAGFEYVILPAKNAFFAKMNAEHTYIRFGDDEKCYAKYNQLKEDPPEINKKSYEFFYLYSNEKIDAKNFLDYLHREALNNLEIRA